MHIKLVVLLVFIIALESCVKEVSFEQGSVPQVLVVNSLFNPTEPLRVNVAKIAPIDDTLHNGIPDANVGLYEDGVFLANLISCGNGWYNSSNFPKANKSYSVVVSHPDYPATFAESAIPQKVKIVNANSYFRGKLSPDQDELLEVTIEFTDTENADNYYEVALISNYGTEYSYVVEYFSIFNMYDPSVLKEGDWDYRPNTIFFSDALFKGQLKVLNIDITGPTRWNQYYNQWEPNPLNVILRSVSKEYFTMRKFWTRHLFNQTTSEHLADPLELLFLGEPIEMYTNIVGGYGVFAGYNEDIKAVTFNFND